MALDGAVDKILHFCSLPAGLAGQAEELPQRCSEHLLSPAQERQTPRLSWLFPCEQGELKRGDTWVHWQELSRKGNHGLSHSCWELPSIQAKPGQVVPSTVSCGDRTGPAWPHRPQSRGAVSTLPLQKEICLCCWEYILLYNSYNTIIITVV